MKHEYKLHLIGILLLAVCVSCGQSVKETVKPAVPVTAAGQFKRVVIVPFADYTPASSLENQCRRNTLVLEAMQDELYRNGFISAAEEDVVKYLVDKGVIQTPKSRSNSYRTASLEQEMLGAWSSQMKEELQDVIYEDMTASSGDSGNEAPIAFNNQILTDLAGTFGADYVVRGRIIEFRNDTQDSFNPLRTGIIPFVFKVGQRTHFGVAESEQYEFIDKDAIENYSKLRDLFWGAGQFATGLIGDKQGQAPGVTIQIRAFVQDAKTGQVVWLNRAETCTLPRTIYADPDERLLVSEGIQQAVSSLIKDFAAACNSGRIAKAPKYAASKASSKIDSFVAEVDEGKEERFAKEAAESADQAKEAADLAIKAAGESKMSAQEAKDAAADAKDSVKQASEATRKSEKIFEKIIAK